MADVWPGEITQVRGAWPGEKPRPAPQQAAPWPGEHTKAVTSAPGVPQVKPPQQPKPAEPSWLSTIGSAVESIPSSAVKAAEGLYDQVRHPIDTLGRLASAQMGLYGRAGLPGVDDRSKDLSKQMGYDMVDPYTSVSKFKKKLSTDPVGVAMDASMIAAPLDAMAGGRGAAAVGRAAGSVARPVVRAGESLRSTFSPARASPAAADTATAFRRFRGTRGSESDRMAFQLGKLSKRIDGQPPEAHAPFYKFIETRGKVADPNGPKTAPLNVPGLERGEYEYAGELGLDHGDIAAANQIRDVYNHYHDEAAKVVKANTNGQIGFVKDYFTHMWAEDAATVEQRMTNFATKQGTGRYFFKRTIPTIEDGIAAGLTPKYGPIQTVQVYTENMGNLLATHETQAFMKANGYARWFRPGQQPEGWQPLSGILTERQPKLARREGGAPRNEQRPGTQARSPAPDAPQLGGPGERPALGQEVPIVDAQTQLPGRNAVGLARPGERPAGGLGGPSAAPQLEDAAANAKRARGIGDNGGPPMTEPPPDRAVQKEQLYAPPEVARLYNNAISKPFDPSAGPAQAVGHAAYKAGVNAMMWKFALSAYHATTMMLESAVSRAAGGVEALSRGQIGTGARKLATAPFAPAVALDYGVRGDLLRRQILGIADHGPFRRELAERFAKTGARLTMDRDYRGTQSKLFYDAWKDGSLGAEMKRQAAEMYKGDAKMSQRAVAAARIVSNLMTSASRPLFEEVIPRIKLGAWSDMMGDYLKANEGAPEAEIQAYANKAWDTIDNRFGEMNRDNMFWSRKTQQVLQAALASPTWKIGSWREIGGGVLDLPESVKNIGTGKGVSPRTAYLLGMATIVPLYNSIYQYMKTGKPPQDGRDLMAGQTGGRDPRTGQPERLLFPGNQKEVFSAVKAAGEGTPGLVQYGLGAGNAVPKAIGEQVMNMDYAGKPLRGDMAAPGAEADWFKDTAAPISMEQQKLKGSNTGMVESLLGAKSAPAYLEAASNAKYERWKRRQAKMNAKAAAKRKAIYQ